MSLLLSECRVPRNIGAAVDRLPENNTRNPLLANCMPRCCFFLPTLCSCKARHLIQQALSSPGLCKFCGQQPKLLQGFSRVFVRERKGFEYIAAKLTLTQLSYHRQAAEQLCCDGLSVFGIAMS